MTQKIAISSENKDIEGMVCSITGRAPYYLIFKNKKLIKTIKNPFVHGSGGAGLSVAQMLYNENVDLVISGKFGPKVIELLNSKGMKYKEIQDKTIKDILEEI